MLRTALTPRYLGLLAVAVVLVLGFTWLGRWQLGVAEGRAQQEAVEQARSQEPVALTQVLPPQSAFPGELSSRPVVVSGRYTDGQLTVPDRRLDGRTGSWVVTPFVVDATGATLPVLRGFVTDPADAGTPPTGVLTLRGGLAPSESPTSVPTGPGEIGSVDTSQLVNTWPGEIYNAFLFLESPTSATEAGLTRVPTPLGPTGVTWRNAAYAVQWWVFAVFALWMWWRTVREGHRRLLLEEADDEGERPGAVEDAAQGDNGIREHL